MAMSSKSNDLKSCPFCGSDKIKAIALGRKNHLVYCVDCGGETRASYRTIDEAIEAWNRRAKDVGE